MAFMATSEVPPDGTPPQIKVTVETIEELAAALVATPALVNVRVVDDDHKEYGEGVQTRRVRGTERDLPEQQLFLGGRPLNEGEKRGLDRHVQDLTTAVQRYGLNLRGVI